mmetsp:Transcript_9493/g.17123  ORF Transcript_9493/g.17123 Transcript_9493/m.17123 type:complete len:931 (-) Transcript_9493:1479-4271(-)
MDATVDLGAQQEVNADGGSKSMESSSEKPSVIRRVTMGIEGFMRRSYFKVGMLVAAKPLVTFVVMFLFAGLCMLGLLRFTQESRAEELWVPQGTEALDNLDFVDEYFSNDLRLINTIVISKDASRPNLASKQGILELINTVNVSYQTQVEVDGEVVTYPSFCLKATGDDVEYCSISSVLDLFYDTEFLTNGPNGQPDFLLTVLAKVESMTDEQVKTKLTVGPYVRWNGGFLDEDTVVGKKSGANETLEIQAYRVAQLLVGSPELVNGEEVDPSAQQWEEQWSSNLDAFNAVNDLLQVLYESTTSQEDSLESALTGDISLFTAGFILLIIYTILFIGQFHFVYSRWVAGLMLFVAIGLALGSTFGLSSLFGLFFGPVHQFLPLLILGIGVDDGFVITRALDEVRSDPRHKDKSPQVRVALALSDAGSAVTVTSLTNSTVFFISAVTELPALRSFALWAGISVLMDLIFSVTFFTAYLAIDERRLDAKRYDVLCCKVSEEPKETNWCGLRKGVLERFFQNIWAPFVLNKYVGALFVLFFTALFGVCIWGTTRLSLNFDFSYFYPDGSTQFEYYDTEQEYFGDIPSRVGIYTGTIEYGTSENQQLLLNLCTPMTGLVAQNEFINSETVSCWYFDMRQFYGLSENQYISSTEFISSLQTFLNSSQGAQYRDDINMTSSEILASRFFGSYIPLDTNEQEVDSMQSLRKTVTDSNLPDSFPYFFGYIFWEQYAVIRGEALLATLLSLVMVFIVSLLLIGNPFVALIVLVSLAFTVVDILGIVNFWNINISSVSVICLSLSVGLSVDFTVHIAKAFVDAVGESRKDRVKEALRALGPPVLHAGVSTFLAIFVLIGAKSFIFRVFFKCFFLIIVLGLAHGFIFVPIVLSFIGPPSFYSSVEEKEAEEAKILGSVAADTKTMHPSDSPDAASDTAVEAV